MSKQVPLDREAAYRMMRRLYEEYPTNQEEIDKAAKSLEPNRFLVALLYYGSFIFKLEREEHETT